jgi:hypothetical protein
MALPSYNFPISDVFATTFDAVLPEVVDSIYGRIPLIGLLYSRFRDEDYGAAGEPTVVFDGGEYIRANILYNKFPAASYGKGDTFYTGFTNFLTAMVFQWKRAYAPINVDALDLAKNAGSLTQIIKYDRALAQNAAMSLADQLDSMFFGDGTGNNGKNFDGLGNGVSASGTYGGITRSSTAGDPGSTIKAYVNSTGGPFSFSMVNQAMANVTFGKIKPDLIITTLDIWQKWWARSQPSERNQPGPVRDIGFDTIRFNGAEVVVDDYCPANTIYLLNTDFIQLWIMKGYDFVRRGRTLGKDGFAVFNQDAYIDQFIVYGDLIVTGPRFQAVIQNVS